MLKKYTSIIFLMVFFMVPAIGAYQRTFCNYGTAPIKVTMHFAGGPVCPDRTESVPNLTNKNKECVSFDTGACCITGVTINGGSGYPTKYFPLDDWDKTIDLHDFRSTGAGMACKDTIFAFWNDTHNKVFSSIGSAGEDYYDLANLRHIQATVNAVFQKMQDAIKRGQQAAG